MAIDPVVTVMTVLGGGVIGAFAGSLVHAAAVRLPADLAPLGAPVCAGCGSPAPSLALVPGWRGACTCGCDDRVQRWATEAAAGALTALALLTHGLTLAGLTVALFNLLLLVILRVDWQHHLIYTVTIVPGIALALALAALRSPGHLASAVIAGGAASLVFALFYVLAVVIYRQRALGFGDILLAALIGAMTGTHNVVAAIFLGMALAAVGGLFLVLIGRRTRRDYIPYGAYLCAGTILVLLFH